MIRRNRFHETCQEDDLMDKNRAGFSDPADVNVGNIKEAVCVDAMRVYDSCSRQHDTGYKPCQ
jgi:hypothetical protein